MVNSQLINYIRSEEGQGYSATQLYDYLVQRGYDANEVSEAIHTVNQPSVSPEIQKTIDHSDKNLHSSSNKNFLTITLAMLGIICLVIGIGWFITSPSCGDGTLDDGETSDNCCLDAGCQGDAVCQDDVCLAPTCGDCQYLQDYICVDHECCATDDCPGSDECISNSCTVMDCGECGYAINHGCKEYVCCKDEACDDNNSATTDQCLNPGSLQSRCSNSVEAETGEESIITAGSKLEFDFEDETHTISIDQIAEYGATLIISSKPQKIFFNIGETKEVDIDGDDLPDVKITLISIDDNSITVTIDELTFECENDFDCNDQNPLTEDRCINAKSPSAFCQNTLMLKDCTNDFNCFISAAQTCLPAKTVFAFEENTSSITTKTTNTLQIRGKKGESCIFYKRITESYTEVSDIEIEKLENESFTQEEIDQLVKTAEKSAASKVNQETTCVFKIDYLTDMLDDWDDNRISPTDLPAEDCEKTMPAGEDLIECFIDADCDDSLANTKDSCINRGTSASYCEYETRGTDCEGSMDCFIGYAEDCELAQLVYTTSFEDEGLLYTLETFYELRGDKGNKCVIYSRGESVSLNYTEQAKAAAIAEGATEEDLETGLSILQKAIESNLNTEGLCAYEIDNLIDFLEIVESGNIDEIDEDACEELEI